MKVLHIALTDGGGAGMGLVNQHKALLHYGIDSKILVAYKQTNLDTVYEIKEDKFWWARNKLIALIRKVARKFGVAFNKYDWVVLKLRKLPKDNFPPFSSPITMYDISRNHLLQEADIINLHFISNFVDIDDFFRKINKPVVWTMRDENPGLGGFHYRKSKEKYYFYCSELENYFLEIKRKAIESYPKLHIVSLSSCMKDFCKSVDYLACHPNSIIYNAISPGDYVMCDMNEARKELGFSQNDIIVSFVCYSLGEKRKRFDEVLKAIEILNDTRIKLVCVGRNDILISNPNVFVLGPITDKNKMSLVYSASNVFVSPSVQESFGKTIIESLYCGTPVVTTPVGIAPDAISDENGVICHNPVPEEIANAISFVLKRTYNRREMRDKAISMFLPQHIASQYVELYRQLLPH